MANIYKPGDPAPRDVVAVQSNELEDFPEEEEIVLELPVVEEADGEVLEEEEALDPEALRSAIMAEAREEAKGLVEQATQEGYNRGFEKGQAAFEESIGECATLFGDLARQLTELREDFLNSLEPQVVDLALLIARQVLAREVQGDEALIHQTVRRALAVIADTQAVTVRVNPQDLLALHEHKVTLLEDFKGVDTLELVADEAIESGGCLIDSELMQADARIETLLANVLSELDG